MTLEEAIEILERHYILHLFVDKAKLEEASKLGIEAMKRLGELRRSRMYLPSWLLPGETEK